MSRYNYGTGTGIGSGNCNNGTCPDQTITAPTKTQYQNIYNKQVVQVIHPIEIVRKYHCCPVYQHSYVYSVRDEVDSPLDPGYPSSEGLYYPGQAGLNNYRKNNVKKKSVAANSKVGANSKSTSKPTSHRMKKK